MVELDTLLENVHLLEFKEDKIIVITLTEMLLNVITVNNLVIWLKIVKENNDKNNVMVVKRLGI